MYHNCSSSSWCPGIKYICKLLSINPVQCVSTTLLLVFDINICSDLCNLRKIWNNVLKNCPNLFWGNNPDLEKHKYDVRAVQSLKYSYVHISAAHKLNYRYRFMVVLKITVMNPYSTLNYTGMEWCKDTSACSKGWGSNPKEMAVADIRWVG